MWWTNEERKSYCLTSPILELSVVSNRSDTGGCAGKDGGLGRQGGRAPAARAVGGAAGAAAAGAAEAVCGQHRERGARSHAVARQRAAAARARVAGLRGSHRLRQVHALFAPSSVHERTVTCLSSLQAHLLPKCLGTFTDIGTAKDLVLAILSSRGLMVCALSWHLLHHNPAEADPQESPSLWARLKSFSGIVCC